MGLKTTIIPLPRNWWSDRLLFQFPDICWAYSLTAGLLLFTPLKVKWVATIVVLFLSMVELEQAEFELIKTDLADIIAMIIATFLSLMLVKHERSI